MPLLMTRVNMPLYVPRNSQPEPQDDESVVSRVGGCGFRFYGLEFGAEALRLPKKRDAAAADAGTLS